MSAQETNGDLKNNQNGIPEWLKPELFENVLKKTIEGYRKIKDFKVTPALKPGENYATVMLLVNLDVKVTDDKTKSVSYMLKVGHDNEIYTNLMKKHNIFDVERGMYTTIIPEMEQMYHDAGLDVQFGAKCYELPIDKHNVLLEDLRPRGFKNINRLEGLDMEHTKSVLKKLALWHAASATRVATKGNYPGIYTCGFFTEAQFEMMKQMNIKLGKVFLQCTKKYHGSEDYYDNLEKYQQIQMDELYKCSKVDPNEFNVLNHGDFWSNNIMFQYDAFGKIKETFFVDYQLPKYGSPAQDLFYFILSSTKYENKLKQFDYLIKYYHENLTEALKLLKYPKKFPALKDIHSALYKYGIWGVITVSGGMAAVLLDPIENASFENFVSNSKDGADFTRLMFSNPRYRKHAEIILPWLYNRGALEV